MSAVSLYRLLAGLGVAALLGAGLWAWQRWGLTVWLDTALSFCL